MQNLKTSKIFKRLRNIQLAYYHYGSNNEALTEITFYIRAIRENSCILELLENANALKPLSLPELMATVKTLCNDLDKAKGR